ncbi:DUF3489 domain-containing protein [Methylobacterium bullatum]|uniref:DUF3489 domain-containing protein n=1 Tax=Methylobacterium bullatum TaxID=570505 RepID=A0AAV4ZEN3_9HYPH|nr:DUF3489 domain-containing protein [Methylobacterium bullatum]MBD8900768.1 hypothetical protein [Methylobacterium bullatum]GJD42073.1 hypothetical protein OICFNHDK_4564 [Methylobacterium bullatum]
MIDETHHTLLKTAAESPDQLIARPAGLNVRAAKALFAKLSKTALAIEVVVTGDERHWHQDQRGSIGLRLTTAGRESLGFGLDVGSSVSSMPVADAGPDRAGTKPRSGTKRALIIAMLQRDDGATVGDLMAATGWLAHSTRATLTGLRKRGMILTKGCDAEGRTAYRLTDDATTEAR